MAVSIDRSVLMRSSSAVGKDGIVARVFRNSYGFCSPEVELPVNNVANVLMCGGVFLTLDWTPYCDF